MPRSFALLFVELVLFATASAAQFPAVTNSGDAIHLGAPAMTAEAAAKSFQLPEGFQVSVFAAEPDVQNPIAMAWDGRGRLWVAENYTYAERGVRFDEQRRDRVVVFEDGGDGRRFSARRVFIDSLQRLTSVEVGYGGVWLMCPPQLLFVPDADRDLVPDGPAEVVLDGFTAADVNHHNFANGLRFGPDGWLYGRCGAASPGEIGLPGTPSAQRLPLRGTMWRYHPTRKVAEVLSAGTTNPWGHDWDEHGELFFINTVNGHLWHGIAGAHYTRAHTIDPNPQTYELIDQHADHWHFDTTRTWQQSRDGAANSLGGGHAHVGMMIYQGENWPAKYRGGLFTLNFHGRRANHEVLVRRGSGYVGRHGADAFIVGDPWFRGIDLSQGPDGAVFVLDWSDTGECHNSTGVNRTSGRIYKIVHGEWRQPPKIDLAQERGRDLAAMQASGNEWLVRQGRLELATRAAAGHKLTHGIEDMFALFEKSNEVRVKLRALWALHAIGGAKREFLRVQLRHPNEHVRTWAVRLLTDDWPLDTLTGQRPARKEGEDENGELVAELARSAREDDSGLVRLALASALQRMPVEQRAAIARGLLGRAEDAADHNLPLMIWYGLIPVANARPAELVELALSADLPTTRRLCARRLAEDIETRPNHFDALLRGSVGKSLAFQADVLTAATQAFTGWRRAKKPPAWDAFAAKIEGTGASAELQARVRELNVLFGDGRALSEVKALALDPKAELAARKTALQALIDARPLDLRDVCERALRVRFLNPIAARGLVLFDDPAIADLLTTAYSTFFHPSERGAAIDALVTRPAFARRLLQAIAAGKIPRAALSAFHARQIRAFGDAELTRQLAEVWGEVREAPAAKSEAMARWRKELTPSVLAVANRSAGRATFNQLCATCHELYGEGMALGPDLTGAGRDNLDYLLENIVDPSAVVTADFRLTVVKLKDGRTLSGFVAARSPQTLTLRGIGESHTLERAEIASTEVSPQSLMPEGLLETLSAEQRRDLIAYLMHAGQVPLPAK